MVAHVCVCACILFSFGLCDGTAQPSQKDNGDLVSYQNRILRVSHTFQETVMRYETLHLETRLLFPVLPNIQLDPIKYGDF